MSGLEADQVAIRAIGHAFTGSHAEIAALVASSAAAKPRMTAVMATTLGLVEAKSQGGGGRCVSSGTWRYHRTCRVCHEPTFGAAVCGECAMGTEAMG